MAQEQSRCKCKYCEEEIVELATQCCASHVEQELLRLAEKQQSQRNGYGDGDSRSTDGRKIYHPLRQVYIASPKPREPPEPMWQTDALERIRDWPASQDTDGEPEWGDASRDAGDGRSGERMYTWWSTEGDGNDDGG